MIPVGWLAPSECWDQNLIRNLTSNRLYDTGLKFRHFQGFPPSHQAEGCILSIPGAYWHDQYDSVNEALTAYRWVLGIRCSDECDLFDVSRIEHANIKWIVQTPRKDYPDARVFGVGYPPHFNDLPSEPPSKDVDVFLSAQNTHVRRAKCFEALRQVSTVNQVVAVHETSGFTQGMDHDVYAATMVGTRVAPAPSGAVSCDSFRFWEALEAHCVPVADTVSPVDGLTDYWTRLFPEAPFPILTTYSNLPGYVQDALKSWPANANRIVAWFMRYKRQLAHWLVDDLNGLGAL